VKIRILLYDGFDELDAIGPYEVFDYAAEYGADIHPEYVTLEPRERVTASHGTRVEPDGTLPEPDTADAPDLLVVPGGGWNARDEAAGAWAEARKGDVPEAVAAYDAAGRDLAGVCTGGMLLAEGGVLDGRPAVTHASALDDLRATDAEVVEARVVDAGRVVTAGGVTSGIDLALYLVERAFGTDVVDTVSGEMEYERVDDVYRAA